MSTCNDIIALVGRGSRSNFVYILLFGATIALFVLFTLRLYELPTCVITTSSLFRLITIVSVTLWFGGYSLYKGAEIASKKQHVPYSGLFPKDLIYRVLFGKPKAAVKGTRAVLGGILLFLLGLWVLLWFPFYSDWYRGLVCDERVMDYSQQREDKVDLAR